MENELKLLIRKPRNRKFNYFPDWIDIVLVPEKGEKCSIKDLLRLYNRRISLADLDLGSTSKNALTKELEKCGYVCDKDVVVDHKLGPIRHDGRPISEREIKNWWKTQTRQDSYPSSTKFDMFVKAFRHDLDAVEKDERYWFLTFLQAGMNNGELYNSAVEGRLVKNRSLLFRVRHFWE
jgi:hypothetical protein